MASTIRLCADDCVIYRKITKNEDIRNIAEISGQARGEIGRASCRERV